MEQPAIIPASPVLSVSALNSLARSALETTLPLLWVGGEISNLTRAASGHWYFNLKDDRAQVKCAMFRGRNQFVDFVPANGDQVEIRAVPTLYEARGEFQLQVELMRRSGLGALFEAFEKLKQKLSAEGLFDTAFKRALPLFPVTAGIVTSPDAAALRDVLTTLRRRAPWINVVLYPTPVQGTGAGAKIAEAINLASQRSECEVLVVCRGGGSIEDLWAFNEETVARAIAGCSIPVICGVGHETDFTIADFAADLRAPTPTSAAEQIAYSRDEWMQRLATWQHKLSRPLHRSLTGWTQQVDMTARRLVHPAQRLQSQKENLSRLAKRLEFSHDQTYARALWRFDALKRRLTTSATRPVELQAQLGHLALRLSNSNSRQLETRTNALTSLSSQLGHLNPDAVLARGFSVVRNAQGEIVRDSSQLRLDELLELRFRHGRAQARVIKKEE